MIASAPEAASADVTVARGGHVHVRAEDTTGPLPVRVQIIPVTGGSVPTASTYMNYVYDPAVAARLVAAIAYVTPVKGAKEELAKTDPEMAANPLIFPDDETLSQVKQFDNAALENDEYITLWQGVLGQ